MLMAYTLHAIQSRNERQTTMRKQQLIDAMDEFTRGYMEAFFWAETDGLNDDGTPDESGGGRPLDCGEYAWSDMTMEALQAIVSDCEAFQRDNAADLAIYYAHRIAPHEYREGAMVEACGGHDFYLTRNGHGCGFWDRPDSKSSDEFAEACQRLSEASRVYGTQGADVEKGRIELHN